MGVGVACVWKPPGACPARLQFLKLINLFYILIEYFYITCAACIPVLTHFSLACSVYFLFEQSARNLTDLAPNVGNGFAACAAVHTG